MIASTFPICSSGCHQPLNEPLLKQQTTTQKQTTKDKMKR